jgi:hypothetical protein
VYDEYWMWPNRRLDLNYAELGREGLVELDRAVVDLGIEVETQGMRGFCEPSKEVRRALQRTCQWWLESGDADGRRLWAHTWHRQMARIDQWSSVGSVPLFATRGGLSVDDWRHSEFDAYSAVLYTNWCDVWEAQRMLVNFLVRASGWIARGIDAKKSGVSEASFAWIADRDLEFVYRGLRAEINHAFGNERSRMYVGDWVLSVGVSGGSSWSEINAFTAGIARIEMEAERLARSEIDRDRRRPCNALLRLIDNMARGHFEDVSAVSFDGMRHVRGGGGVV